MSISLERRQALIKGRSPQNWDDPEIGFDPTIKTVGNPHPHPLLIISDWSYTNFFLSDVLAAVHLLLDAVAVLPLVAHVHLGREGEVVVQELPELHQLISREQDY